MDNNRSQQSMCEKINLSIKKSHKISIYSRKTNKSPKKQQDPFIKEKKYEPLYQQQQTMSSTQPLAKELILMGLNNNNPQSVQLNSAKNYTHQKGNNNNMNQQPLIMQRSLSQYNNLNSNNNYGQQVNRENKINLIKQLSYQQKHLQNDFFNQPGINNNKKINTFNNNTFVNANNVNTFNNTNNVHDISGMIDKEAESQINNLSMLEGSFMTGNRNKLNKQSHHSLTNNIINTNNTNTNNSNINNSNINATQQQQSMDNFMKLLHEQISIVKQNYQQKFNLLIKNNSKLYQNHKLLKQKTIQISNMKDIMKKYSANYTKKIHSEGQIINSNNNKDKRSLSIGQQVKIMDKNNNNTVNSNNNNNNSSDYYEKRVCDLQSKIRVFQGLLTKQQQNQRIQKKVQILQKGSIQYFSSKLSNIQTRVQQFIGSSSGKLSTLYQSMQSLTVSLLNFNQETNRIGFNQNKLKQFNTKINQIQQELREFLQKQFKYQNYGVYQLSKKITKIKERMKHLQQQKIQSHQIVKQLISQINNNKYGGQQNRQQQKRQQRQLINLSHAQQTMSKYTQSMINNTSKNSISQHQYSHLIQKLNPNIYYNNNNMNQHTINMSKRYLNNLNNTNNNNGTSSESFIQLNFTLQEGEQSMGGQSQRNKIQRGMIKCNEQRQRQRGMIKDNEQRQRMMIKNKQQKGQSNIMVSKYTMRTANQVKKAQNNNNIKDNYIINNNNKITNSQHHHQQTATNNTNNNNVSPSIISKLSLPNTRPSISIQSILSPPNLSSTQEKIRNLSQLKMESKQRHSNKERLSNKQGLSSISSLSHQHFSPQQTARSQQQTPRSPLQKDTNYQYNNFHNNNNNNNSSSYLQNNSYLSIGQLQDYHQSVQYQHLLQLEGNRNNTSYDWSDDQFFYPELMQKQYEQQSNVQNYCWDKNQQLSSRQQLSPKNNYNSNNNNNNNSNNSNNNNSNNSNNNNNSNNSNNSNTKQLYSIPKAKTHNNNANSSKLIQQSQQFSPMKKKLISTQTNFYQSMKYNHNNTQQSSPTCQKLTKTKTHHQLNKLNHKLSHQNNHQHQLPPKKLIYSGNFDYQKFSDSQQEKQEINKQNSPFITTKNNTLNSNLSQINKFPPQQLSLSKNHQKPSNTQQHFTINQQKLIQKIKIIPKSQLPIKFIYDRKKSQAIAKMPNPTHQLNGKSFLLQRKQLEKLQHLGFIQVKTYI